MPGKKQPAAAPKVVSKESGKKTADKKGDKKANKKGGDKKVPVKASKIGSVGGKARLELIKQLKAQPKPAQPLIRRYPRLKRKEAAAIKASQARFRALKVAKAIQKGKTKKGVARFRKSTIFRRPRTLRLPRNPKYPASYSQGTPSNHKSAFNIIKYPLQTESAMQKIEDLNTIVFIVDPRANKHQIKKAVETLYNIKADKVNTLIRPDGLKKAFVRLVPDQKALEVASSMGFL